MTKNLLSDIEARKAGIPVDQRIKKLTKSLKTVGIALVLPVVGLSSMPQAQAGTHAKPNTDVNTVEEARAAGKSLAHNMFAGAYADWLQRQEAAKVSEPDHVTSTKPETKVDTSYSKTDFARAQCEFFQATSSSPIEQQKAGGSNAALRATIEDFNTWRTGKSSDLATSDAEFIKIYKEKEKTLQSNPAFNAVVNEKALQLNQGGLNNSVDLGR